MRFYLPLVGLVGGRGEEGEEEKRLGEDYRRSASKLRFSIVMNFILSSYREARGC